MASGYISVRDIFLSKMEKTGLPKGCYNILIPWKIRDEREFYVMERISFSRDEMEVKGYYDSVIPEKPGVPVMNSPVSTKENIIAALSGQKPLWYPSVGMAGGDYKPFRPRMFPDNYTALSYIMDGEPPVDIDHVSLENPGWFDTLWRYEPVAGGPMIVPGSQKIDSICDWETLTFPNLDDLDWEGSTAVNQLYLNTKLPVEFCIPCGYWERLMSILEVSEAAMELIDEDCQPAIHEFFDKLTDLYIDLVKRAKQYYHIEMVLIHDDWGHQNGQFFSVETNREMIFPYLKRLIDACHSMGIRFELHCCGKAENFVPLMIEAGVDLWCPQTINDYQMLAEKYSGKGIIFGFEIEPVTDGMPEEKIYSAAKKFVDTYKNIPVAYVNYGGSEKFYKYVYELSRKALSE